MSQVYVYYLTYHYLLNYKNLVSPIKICVTNTNFCPKYGTHKDNLSEIYSSLLRIGQDNQFY